jgi:hypothetical protein
VEVPRTCRPGSEVIVRVDTGRREESAVFLVVKDARLVTTDAPAQRLAGQIKATAETISTELKADATRTLADVTPPPAPPRFGWLGLAEGLLEMASPGFTGVRSLAASPRSGFGVDEVVSYLAAEVPRSAPPAVLRKTPRAGRPADAGEEPVLLFAGLVSVRDGKAEARVRLGSAFADYVAEAFVVSGLDWASGEGRFRAEKDPFVSLDLPAFVHPRDTARGRVHVGARSGGLRVRVTRDGADVPLLCEDAPLAPGAEVGADRAELTFAVGPGEYRAVVEDAESGAADEQVRRVEEPGKLRLRTRTLRFLEPGQGLSRADDPSVLALRVLPGLDRPLNALVEATADYGHACCEQTAAKLLAACAMYVLAGEDPRRRTKAEAVILAGVRRERSMWLPGRGFKMYPELADEPHPYYGPKAARYLRDLDLLRQASPLSPALAEALEQGLEMAKDAGAAYKLPWPPTDPTTAEDAHAALRWGKDPALRERALRVAREVARQSVDRPAGEHAYLGAGVWRRAEQAYAAAALLRAGDPADRPGALGLANAVVGQLNEEGRLYSTVDSVAALALLAELRASGLAGGRGKAEVDGRALTTREAGELGEVASVRALEGVVVVEVTRQVEESWDDLAPTVPLRVTLEKGGATGEEFRAGALELRVRLLEGYRTGDLLWVCLPEALSRLVGGGQLKRFALDFAGADELAVPLAATAPGKQHLAVCVRNMFDEDRAGNPGPLTVTVGGP